MFEKILVPVDGSIQSEKALKTAIGIAEKCSGKITLIHVYSKPGILAEPPQYPPSNEAALASTELLRFDNAIQKAAAEILAKGEKEAKSKAVVVEKLLRKGHVVEEILKASKEGEFDLIVMGSRGEGIMRELFLGSTTEGVVRHSSTSVLVVK